MIHTLLRLSPLEPSRTRELIDQFDGITRAVVVATLLSAFVQGILLGAGFYVAGVGSVFLLTALAMLLTLVPFVGSAIVYVPVCLWQFGIQGHTTSAVLLGIYSLAIAVTIDNVVKPMVLHGRSNLHPLLALLSVLGGVRALGPIGILVGPMVVAFLQTLLKHGAFRTEQYDEDARGAGRDRTGNLRDVNQFQLHVITFILRGHLQPVPSCTLPSLRNRSCVGRTIRGFRGATSATGCNEHADASD